MKRIILFTALIFSISFSTFAQSIKIPDDEFIKTKFPTLQKYQYFYKGECRIYYSEKFVTKTIADTEGISVLDEKTLFTFKGMDDACIKNLLGPRLFFNKEYIGNLPRIYLIVITDSGYIYLYGQYKEYRCNVMEKYIIVNNKIEKVEQPLYYINCMQKTNCDFYIKSKPDVNSENVALISKNSEIEVVGVKEVEVKNQKEDWVLIKSVLGLTGWVKVFMTGPYLAGQTEGFLPIFSMDEIAY